MLSWHIHLICISCPAPEYPTEVTGQAVPIFIQFSHPGAAQANEV